MKLLNNYNKNVKVITFYKVVTKRFNKEFGLRDCKTIAIMGFKGGVGKSTIANFLAEKLENSVILNLDLYQDAEDFNSSYTINLSKNQKIEEIKNQNEYDYIVVDAGGFDDERLSKTQIDLFIFPTRTDYRSIKTTVDSATTILQNSKSVLKNVMFIFNQYESEKELNSAVEILKTIINLSNIVADDFYFFGIKKSNAVKTAIDKKMSIKELMSSSKLASHTYKSFNNMFDELAKEVKEIVEN
ncbi:ParA family protein [Hydrogenimonas thermophila]|uniref:Cellulose biosynthesis protein BcsQ n=1 Tax=Hydrogenimonas thermophila TaxID=223786 RepID=A0A1I5UM06_9BACT|nr:ParA family protein [Hydrogenimonas thermophila]SFP96238.1 Cellulose biosynthesis protein BcsQ [Hydrogenimonas thermophila]